MTKATKRTLKHIDKLQLSAFMYGYHQAGMTPEILVELASRMKGGREAIIGRAFSLTVA